MGPDFLDRQSSFLIKTVFLAGYRISKRPDMRCNPNSNVQRPRLNKRRYDDACIHLSAACKYSINQPVLTDGGSVIFPDRVCLYKNIFII